MRKIIFNPSIPVPSESLLQNFADVKLVNRLSDLGSHNATQVFKVGAVDGSVDVPGKPGYIYMRAVYPSGPDTVTQCYVPTYEDGTSKVAFEADQIITPKRQGDTSLTYWIYDGIPPTPLTQAMPLANSFGPVYGNAFPNDDGSVSGTDAALPNKLTVDHVGKYSAGVTTPLTYTLTDSGQTDPATGERLWYRNYTGPDYDPTPVPTGETRAPAPPTDPLVEAFFDPCKDKDKDPPLQPLPLPLPPLGNHPVIPPITPLVPRPPDPRPTNPKPPRTTPSGYRPPPNSPPYVPPYRPPAPPSTPVPLPLPPPGGPGSPPPSPGDPGGAPGEGGGGGTWDDDGTNITGCFGTPVLLDTQISYQGDASDPNSIGSTLRRNYYNIRVQIDGAIARLMGGGLYKPKDLIYVTLLFDGIDEIKSTRTYLDGSFDATEPVYSKPRVFHTKTSTNPVTEDIYIFEGPLINQSKTYDMPPGATITTEYKVWEFENHQIGSDLNPLGCEPLHYSYTLNTLPPYSDTLEPLLAAHPGYRLYISCFKVKKDTSTVRQLPYSHDFAAGTDGWSERYDTTRSPLGGIMETRAAFHSPGPFNASQWISGWTITLTGWSDRADDLFNNTFLSNGVFGVDVTDGVGTVLASGSKNMYGPISNHGDYPTTHPYTFTWSFNNNSNVMLSPCGDYYFVVGGGNALNSIWLKKIVIVPITGVQPFPDGGGPGTPLDGGAPGTGSSPADPRNGSGSPIPQGTPLSPSKAPDAGAGSDGSAAPVVQPANGSPANGPVLPVGGIAPALIPVDGPVEPKTSGLLGGYSGFKPGQPVYLGTSAAGAVSQTKPTCSGCIQQSLGTAADPTTLDINIGPAIILL